MAGVFSNATKTMLKNVIRHTNSHNKTVEEAEMWQQHERQKELGGLDPSNPSFGHDDRCSVRNDRGDRRRNDYWNSRSEKRAYLSTSNRSRRAHMDDEEEKVKGGSSTSTYWMRQLDKLEASDPNRWDHSGYRELYPNDFKSDRSDSESPRLLSRHQKRDRTSRTKKKKKHRSRSKKTRVTEKKSRRHPKLSRKRSPSISSSSASESDSESTDSSSAHHQKHQHISRRRRYDKTKSFRYASSDSTSSSYSDSDSDSGHREHSQGHQRKRRKETVKASARNRCQYNKTKSRRFPSAGSRSRSCSELDFDRRGHMAHHKRKRRKTIRDSSVSTCSTDWSDSASSLERKNVKKQKAIQLRKTKLRKRSKQKKKSDGKPVHKKRVDREGGEHQLVVKMWKGANGYEESPDSDFDRRLHREISSQYLNLKRQYTQQKRPKGTGPGDFDRDQKDSFGQHRNVKQQYSQQKHSDHYTQVNGNSSFTSRKRRHSSSSSYSSD